MPKPYGITRHVCKSCGAVKMDRREPGVDVLYWIRCDECVGIMAPDPMRPLIESS